MKSKTPYLSHAALLSLPLALLAAAGALNACAAEFRTECPPGTTQTAGGGDVDDACTPIAGSGGGAGAAGGNVGGAAGSSSTNGAGGSPSNGGQGGGGTGGVGGVACQPAAGAAGAPGAAQVRVAHMSPDAGPLKVCARKHDDCNPGAPFDIVVTESINYKQVAGYAGLPSGELDLRLVLSGASCENVGLIDDVAKDITLTDGEKDTLVVRGALRADSIAGLPVEHKLGFTLAKDEIPASVTPDHTAVRFMNAAIKAPPVDVGIYFDGVNCPKSTFYIPWKPSNSFGVMAVDLYSPSNVVEVYTGQSQCSSRSFAIAPYPSQTFPEVTTSEINSYLANSFHTFFLIGTSLSGDYTDLEIAICAEPYMPLPSSQAISCTIRPLAVFTPPFDRRVATPVW